jgi:uncharacterized protein YndB with AHSA1/START domain
MTDTTRAAPHAIERIIELSVPRERVWRAITDPEELARWFPQKADWQPEPGREGVFTWDGYGGYAVRVEAVEPPTYLAWRWANQADTPIEQATEVTLVEWWLEESEDGGTILRMQESGFLTPAHREGNAQGWDEELAELEALLGA